MTTIVNFTPSSLQPIQFSATLDSSSYNCICTWNISGQRWYITVYDTNSNVILNLPLIASPLTYPINILAGYFTTSTLVYYVENQQIIVSP